MEGNAHRAEAGLLVAGLRVAVAVALLLALWATGLVHRGLPQWLLVKMGIVRIERDRPIPSCTSNQKQVLLCLLMYAEANGGWLPPDEGWEKALDAFEDGGWLMREGVFQCPQGKRHYRYFGGGRKLSEIKDPAATVLLLCRFCHDGRRSVCFADGHHERLELVRISRILAATAPGEMPVVEGNHAEDGYRKE